MDVEVDNSSIEVNADALRVKALGITNAMLAGSIDGAKIENFTFTDEGLHKVQFKSVTLWSF